MSKQISVVIQGIQFTYVSLSQTNAITEESALGWGIPLSDKTRS